MEKYNHLADNLIAIKKVRQKTLSEFSVELGIPKSTLQCILKDGQTTLDTAIRISKALHMPIDALVNREYSPEELSLLGTICRGFAWFRMLGEEEKNEALFHLSKILELMNA